MSARRVAESFDFVGSSPNLAECGVTLSGAAMARLYDDHVDSVHALLTRRVGPEASPNLVAETFEHALRTWERFDQERGTERLFLFGAAVAVLRRHPQTERDHLRALKERNDLSSGVTVVDPLVSGGRAVQPRVVSHRANDDILQPANPRDASGKPGSILMAAVADLSPDDRDIVLLSLWESCPQAAIAEALDLSVGVVRSALGRIRRDLKNAVTKSANTTAGDPSSRSPSPPPPPTTPARETS